MEKIEHRQSNSLGKGLTLVEFLIAVGILALIAALAVSALRGFQKDAELTNSSGEVRSIVRLAQSKTVASEDQTTYGVFFDTSALPHEYTLFKGSSYASRVVSFDETHALPDSVEMFGVNFGGGSEVVFDRIHGTTASPGGLGLRLKSDALKTSAIYVESSGKIASASSVAVSDTGRLKDSRHVHIDYVGRNINTATESLVLTFSATSKTIVIADNIVVDGMGNQQIYWEGEVTDAGETQKIKLHTHTLNDGLNTTQFSIHRDRRFNTKPLTIDINAATDPDPGTLIQYAANGVTAQGTSIYVSTPNLQ